MTSQPHLNGSQSDIERVYGALRLIRRVEERIAEIYPSDKIKSPVHLSIGQEAVAVGVCDALAPDDFAVGTYRGHALYLAKGGDLRPFMAEMYGKADGCAAGKGGSMHLVSMAVGMLGSSAVVSTNIPIALGFALKLKRDGGNRVIACFFGDGATEEGVFYESLNFAALKKLPVLFVCENNGLAIHAPIEKRWSKLDIGPRVEGFGIPWARVEDQDVFAIRDQVGSALESIRRGDGPFFLECHTCRWRAHVGPNEDFEAGYRSRVAAAPWIESDPVVVLGRRLPDARRAVIDAEIEHRIDDAIAFAEQSPFPDQSELYTDVFAE